MTLNDFNIKYGECTFKRYPYLNEEWILQSFLREILDNALPIEVYDALIVAWNSRFWETKGYDSSTVVKDSYEPRLAPFLHDMMYRCGYANKKSDKVFKWLLKMTGSNIYRYNRDYLGVRTFGSVFRLRHYINGNIKVYPVFDNLYDTLKLYN